ncbi:MAG TPA: GFA family protein [Caulobacter sp.]|nr:GFA family protein [Caulobacter sp.]
MHKGSCLCGAVRFSTTGDLHHSDACHCSMCRKASGHFWASADVPKETVTIEGEALRWYHSSEKVRRGFCGTCGSQLFWDPIHGKRIALAMGALDKPTGSKLAKHIFVADKGDYYEIADGLPQEMAPPSQS